MLMKPPLVKWVGKTAAVCSDIVMLVVSDNLFWRRFCKQPKIKFVITLAVMNQKETKGKIIT